MFTGWRFALIVGVVAGAALDGGVLWASIPDSSGLIHGCYLSRTGAVRVIDTALGQTCTSS
jgi:hypothetical protein